ncbi:hypothetical protein GCM10027344_15710 [Spelaeicoccus albus]|uniref:Uncharacterized protein n=1 Tax=Spelaeicoccus albus TaxID=1280376 RepID=A0A7Z0D4H1_9MICO|nr:hypothetical protein [Spelaeicoccus albus]
MPGYAEYAECNALVRGADFRFGKDAPWLNAREMRYGDALAKLLTESIA